MVNYLEYFDLTANYSIAKLKIAYFEKINSKDFFINLEINAFKKYLTVAENPIRLIENLNKL